MSGQNNSSFTIESGSTTFLYYYTNTTSNSLHVTNITRLINNYLQTQKPKTVNTPTGVTMSLLSILVITTIVFLCFICTHCYYKRRLRNRSWHTCVR